MGMGLIKVPREMQTNVIKITISKQREGISSKPVLLVKATGGGKSLVIQTIGVINAGVVIVIENTSSLSADKAEKIRNASKSCGNISSIHLDQVKKEEDKKALSEVLVNLKECTQNTFFIFSLPETLLDSIWIETVQMLVISKVLRLVCINKVHRLFMFGCLFHYKFKESKSVLF